jgi:hypothetical protein
LIAFLGRFSDILKHQPQGPARARPARTAADRAQA